MTRTKPADERRADLLAAGRALFLAKGVAATSLEDITSAAGMSKGLFYLYFRSKEELLLGLQEQFSREFAERLRDAVATEGAWTGRLDACTKASFEYYRELHDLHEILFHHAPHDNAGQHRHEPLVAEVIAGLLAEGAAAGAFDVADPEMTAVLCYASMLAFDPGFHGCGQSADERLLAAAQELFRRAAGIR